MGNEQSNKAAEKFFTDAGQAIADADAAIYDGLESLFYPSRAEAKAKARAAVGQLPSGGPAHVGHPSQGQAGQAAERGKAMLDRAIGKTTSQMFTFWHQP